MLEHKLDMNHIHYEPQQYCKILKRFEEQSGSIKRLLDYHVHKITEDTNNLDKYVYTLNCLYKKDIIDEDVKNIYNNIALSMYDVHKKKEKEYSKQLYFNFYGDDK